MLSKTMLTTRLPSRTVPLATAKTETPHVPLLSALSVEQEDAAEVVLPVELEAEAEVEGTVLDDTTMTSMCCQASAPEIS